MTAAEDTAVVVARTNDPVDAAIWVDALRQEGIAATGVERGVGPALGGLSGVGHTEIVVRQSQLASARSVIAELDGAMALTPVSTAEERDAATSRALRVLGYTVGVVVLLGLVVRFVV